MKCNNLCKYRGVVDLDTSMLNNPEMRSVVNNKIAVIIICLCYCCHSTGMINMSIIVIKLGIKGELRCKMDLGYV